LARTFGLLVRGYLPRSSSVPIGVIPFSKGNKRRKITSPVEKGD
jgi:hypothetical protein